MSTERRFEILRTLGEGGMGVVYEARDKVRDMTVALKQLRSRDANLLYHFKNEFRGLADLHHHNLCTLFELFEAEGNWFFTMELVEGCDLEAWIRPPQRRSTPYVPRIPGDAGTMLEFVGSPLATPVPERVSMQGFDEGRLRAALAQLATGLNALHAAGKVHRDIKPGNILVTPAGRVVIMDFGLVADEALLAEFATAKMIAGTPVFMAPEQGIPGAAVDAAVDWYAVGVILYQVLTSRLPFDAATVQELIYAKRTAPPAPDRVAPGVPADLAELCARLLAPDPAARPDGDEVLRVLGGRAEVRARAPVADVFVGRRAELAALHDVLAESRRRAVAVFVEGASGLGKTALVKRFLDDIAGGTMVLRGRCYAEESVPYKAFDGIVDALTRGLVTMDPARAAALVPVEAAQAARLFPVLRRVPWFGAAVFEEGSGVELRARAFAGLVEVLRRIGASQPLVLFVDDLQWADADSMLLLRELLYSGTAPLVAFVASVRSAADGDTGGDLARAARIEPRRLRLEPLGTDDAALLVDRLLGGAHAEQRAQIAREGAGHPMFLAELAHHVAQHGGTATSARLDDALWDRAATLEGDARRLLEIVAVAGTPVDARIVADACAISPTRSAPLVAALRSDRFVKLATLATGDALEPYHDRVRESVVHHMGRDTFAETSGRLAHALLRAGLGESSPELVVRHLFAAGEAALGRDLAERAATRALGALAFDRAAEFLRAALVAGPRDAAHRRALHVALAESLASAGRGAEAADEFLAAGDLDDDTRDNDADIAADDPRRRTTTMPFGFGNPEPADAGGAGRPLDDVPRRRSTVPLFGSGVLDARRNASGSDSETRGLAGAACVAGDASLDQQRSEAPTTSSRSTDDARQRSEAQTTASRNMDDARPASGRHDDARQRSEEPPRRSAGDTRLGSVPIDDDVQLDLRRRAADQLLASGHVERGLTQLAYVLERLGERVPATPAESLASLEAERAALDTASAFRETGDVSADLARRHDVFQSTSLGLILVDNVRGADFQARATRVALAAGDPRRALRALVFEAIYRAQEGDAGRARAVELIARASEIARGRSDAWMDAYLELAAAFHAYYCGRFREAVERFKECDARFRRLSGVAWEQNTIRLHRLRATDYQGAWGELRSLYDEYLRDAQRRDDRYVEASITRWFNVLWLAHDRPDLAGADLDKRVWTPPQEGRYHLQHFLELRARVELALYRGDGAAQGAWARPALEAADRSLLLRIQIARAIADWLLGRIAACESDVTEVVRRSHVLVEQRVSYAAVWSGLLVAAAVHQRGDRRGTVTRLDAVAAFADDHDLPLCAAVARLRAGQIVGGSEGAARVAHAAAWMTGQDIRDPVKMCDVFAPGFGHRDDDAVARSHA